MTIIGKIQVPIIILWFTVLNLGCSVEYPENFDGEVDGEVTYDGVAINTLQTPVLIVSAYAYQPGLLNRLRSGERVTAHASFILLQPVFGSTPIPYHLYNIEPYEKGYFVTAVIIDLENPQLGAVASGVFPENSLMMSNPQEGPVKVAVNEFKAHIDVAMMDIPK